MSDIWDPFLSTEELLTTIIFAIFPTLLLMNTIYRLILELRQYRYDLLKLTQFAFMFMFWAMWIIFYISWLLRTPLQVFQYSALIAFTMNIGYIAINQLLWVLIIAHIPNLMKWVGDHPKRLYEVLPMTRKVEKLSILIISIILWISILANMWPAIHYSGFEQEDYNPRYSTVPEQVSGLIGVILFVCFINSEIYLYWNLMPIINKHWDFDKNNKKYFRILWICNVIYFTGQILVFSVAAIFGFSFWENSVGVLSTTFYNSRHFSYLFKVLLFIMNTLPVLYAYLNIRNVSFKTYLGNFLDGISKHDVWTSECSLFIVSSWLTYGAEEDPLIRSEDAETDYVDSSSSHQYTDSFLQEDMVQMNH